tara:strand:+ start:822 stop:998 length:177 start_codon:yes stop_codon:yes gene_type:complete
MRYVSKRRSLGIFEEGENGENGDLYAFHTSDGASTSLEGASNKYHGNEELIGRAQESG